MALEFAGSSPAPGAVELDFHNRDKWPAGEWDNEEDEEYFLAYTLICRLRRNHFGAWCGYVSIQEGHPLYGKHYDEVDLAVHGGLTFSGEEDGLWWFGFDCCHAWDYAPGLHPLVPADHMLDKDVVYRTIGYAKNETIKLAAQLIEIIEVGHGPL